ncbi:MAG TPA: ABC transporter permease [Candidatus Acidoferrales bacterium]|nr:ABC transporter permease [Candidatus Acidoferrales bacterium]
MPTTKRHSQQPKSATSQSMWTSIEQFARDTGQIARALRRTPGFSAIAILVIALGVGATTALFTVVKSVLLEPLPFKDPSRLVRLYEESADGKFLYNIVSGGIYDAWRKESHDFESTALISGDGVNYNISTASGQLPERVHAARCEWTMFSTLGVSPALGRTFTASEDQLSANGTVVLTWSFWQRRFGGDSAIIGNQIHLDDKPYTVLGVLPAWFTYPDQRVQFWTPIYHEVEVATMQAIQDHEFRPIGRLKPGVSESEATAELTVITSRIHDANRDKPFVSNAANSKPLLEDMVGDTKAPLYILLAATACLLLIGCLNVASLLVARGTARRKETAIRTALGSSRWRLIRGHLVESGILCVAGGALGLLGTDFAIAWLVKTRQDLTRVESIHIDASVIADAALLVFVCAIFAGSVSSFSIRGDRVLAALQESSRSTTAGQGRVRLRKWLLAAEVALTVVLLVGAGLLLESYSRLRSTNVGSITQHILTMRFSLPDEKYSKPAQRTEFFETVLQRVRALPGVQAATFINAVPGQGYYGDTGFAVAEHPPLPPGSGQYAIDRWCDPGYFAALGVPFLSGHTFDENQRLDQSNETIISDSFARRYFPGEDPIGKHLDILGHKRPYAIVGVVGDTRHQIAEPPQPMMYFPFFSGERGYATLAIRVNANETSLALPVQQIVQQMDSELAVSDVLTINQIIARSTLNQSFDATLLLAFAVLSLLLAAVGLFGVLSYIVAGRTSEIGIRIALGAQQREVLWLVLVDGLSPAAAGLVLGLAGGAAAAQLIRAALFGVQPFDYTVFAAVAALLLSVSVAACFMPAWRASRLDPMQALRNE